MIGHGRPSLSRGQCAYRKHGVVCRGFPFALAMLAATLVSSQEAVARESKPVRAMRVRVAWGGGEERMCQGAIWLSEGILAEPRPLGIEADEPGSMWLEANQAGPGNRLVIRQRSLRAYDGVDLLIDAPADAKLLVELAVDGQSPVRTEVPLADLLGSFSNTKLDDLGNQLLVRRTPGDKLRVKLADKSLVFSPGQLLKLDVQPHLLPVSAGAKVQIDVELVAGRTSRRLWSQRESVVAGEMVVLPLEVPLPDEEGVYDLVITAEEPRGLLLPQGHRLPLGWNQKPVARRKIQLLVLGPKSPATDRKGEVELRRVVEIDPANPKWWARLAKLPQLPRLQRMWKGPLGNGNSRTWQHPLGQLVLLAPSGNSDDVSWEAYTLPVEKPGVPHVLEVDYPSDVSQTLGISILEPNAAGALMPIGLDSGVDRADEVADQQEGRPPRWMRHRLIFWPRTKAPMVLITNRRKETPAAYGKIRVLVGGDRLPRAFSAGQQRPERLLAAYLDRPLFPECFCAGQSLDKWSNRSLDDWMTFHQGGTRLVEYLNYVGLGGLMISVLADGSTIYPSSILQPTPRYDTGVFFDTGQDPVRKDVLEMLFRLFDREQLQLIPALEFAAPLPELEAILRQGAPQSQGIEWVGPDGHGWSERYPAERGLAPYYNVLDPRVQDAMLAVVRELVGAYGHHRSFAGLAIQLSGRGYAQLPGPEWGMDDATIARLGRDTGWRLPGSGPERVAERAKFLAGHQNRRRWLQWRAEQLNRFYRRVESELPAIRPEGRLYLAGANMLAGRELEQKLRPTLPRKMTMAEALLQVGIDAAKYRDQDGPILLRPERIAPQTSFSARAVDLEIKQMPDLDRAFEGSSRPGSLFFHQPLEVHVASFDRKRPFRPSYTWLVAHAMPSGSQNRRRFVHNLAALDAQVMFDGGWLLPMGQEDSIAEVVAVYRRLPAVRFKRVSAPRGSARMQPVTIRYATHDNRTYIYVVNDAPFAATARVYVEGAAGCRLTELTGSRRVAPLKHDSAGTYWSIELKPYDLAAVWLSSPDVRLSRPQVFLAEEVRTRLDARIRDLGARAAALRKPSPLNALRNPSFELRADAKGGIPGWATPNQPDVTVRLDPATNDGDRQSAILASNGPIGSLVSDPFESPATGRLSMWVWLRVADAARQPPLRLALEGQLNGRPYYRFAPVGANAVGANAAGVPLATQWTPYVFQVDDLPLEGLSQLQVRFDLMGPGEVWIDDVQLFDLRFNEKELRELSKLITVADHQLRSGQLVDCIRLLESYWPRFLEENVPLEPAVAERSKHPRPVAEPPKQHKNAIGILDRVKNLLPEKMRF